VTPSVKAFTAWCGPTGAGIAAVTIADLKTLLSAVEAK
jgi:hypothetical protein